MAKDTIYTFKLGGQRNQYTAVKMTPDFDVIDVYTLTETGNSLHCDCPAHKPWCRHCEMLRLFQAEERVSQGWFYQFETKTWTPPMTVNL